MTFARTASLPRLALAGALVVTLGCQDAQAPGSDQLPERFDVLGSLIVSDPAALGGAPAASSSAAAADGVVYASLPPGSVPGGEQAVIENRRTGALATAPMVEGGFDPVPIAALAGDTLALRIHVAGDSGDREFSAVVPERRPPIVVRTDPPPQKRDVPLNAVLLVVFSEPLDAATLTDSAVQLFLGEAPVEGTLAFSDAERLTVRFTPAAPLVASAEYVLLVTEAVADLDGDALEAPVTIAFATGLPNTVLSGVFERVTPHTTPGERSRYVLRDDGSFELQRETGTDTRVYPGRYFVDWSNADLVVLGFDEFPEGTAYGQFLGDFLPGGGALLGGDALLAVAYNEAMIQAGFEEGFYTSSPDTAAAGGPPPQAGQIAFVRDGQIHLVNTDGTGLVRVSDGPQDSHPAWSPDGQRIAFTRWRSDASGSATSDIYVMNADGSNLVQRIAGHRDPSWSSDGRFLATIGPSPQDRGDLFVIPATDDGTAPVNLTDPGYGMEEWSPAWSPDGVRIAFVKIAGSPGTSLGTFVTSGPGRQGVLVSGLAQYQPAWSPDGERLAAVRCPWSYYVCSSSVMHVANVDGSGIVALAATKGFARPAWSPDGQIVAFTGFGGIDWVMADGSARGAIVADGHSPAWRPATGPVTSGEAGIYLASVDGSDASWLVRGTRPAWSPDGNRIAFVREGGIHAIDADGSNERLVTQGADPAWSPDGERIVFAGGTGIAVITLSDSSIVSLIDRDFLDLGDPPYSLGKPAWSPDGGSIAFERDDGAEWTLVQIYVMNADGSAPRRLTSASALQQCAESDPSWSADGSLSLVAYWSYCTGISLMDRDGVLYGAFFSPFEDDSSPFVYGSRPSLSPDGQMLLASGRWWTGAAGLFMLGRDGTGLRVLVPGGYHGTWSPDGSRIAFVVGNP